MKLPLFLCSIFTSLLIGPLYSQSDGVGIGTTNVAPHAILEVKSESKGVLLPRVTSLPSITDPANKGLLLYNSIESAFYRWDDNWQRLIHTNSSASVTTLTATGNITTTAGNLSISAGDVQVSSGDINLDQGDLQLNAGNASISGLVTANALSVSSSISTNTIDANGNITTDGQFVGNGTIPKGGIIMWAGTTVPSGWALCDGTNGTVDLSNRFVIGTTTDNIGSGTYRAKLDPSINSDFSHSSSNCDKEPYIYSGTGQHTKTGTTAEDFTINNVKANNIVAAHQKIYPDYELIEFYTHSKNDNSNYYLNNENCRAGIRYYKLAYIMRKD
ncbi:tail fiber protein [Marinoscillum furvescens]|uniref:Tail collar domain n=1 Tax=Marinoscillum furvescens DSM 4134 TaxID=1122208 RepID=A0A3D9L7T9_MARFU|nr:tail fiber protein [Marinoscillum furvescens]REE00547.1 tail collar domain [Marinoscillum furvescens DSM 4134]